MDVAQNGSNLILFTDEANFSRNPIGIFHNYHVWTGETLKIAFNISLGGNYSWLPNRTGIFGKKTNWWAKPQLFGETLPQFLDDVPLVTGNAMQRILARQFSTVTCRDRWISPGGSHVWPVRSSDFNPLDYFPWKHLKSLANTTPVEDVEDLRNWVLLDVMKSETNLVFLKEFGRRWGFLHLSGGSYFEQILLIKKHYIQFLVINGKQIVVRIFVNFTPYLRNIIYEIVHIP